MDSYVSKTLPNFYMFGVFDGHGPFGDKVSNLVKMKFEKEVKYEDLNSDESIKNLFNWFQRDVELQTEIDAKISGTTACLVFVTLTEIICVNLGDSKAVLNHNTKIVNLSSLHNVENE